MDKLLVIIVSYNAMRWAERCFNSLHSSTIVPDVFVLDNGSTDGTQVYIKKHFPTIIFRQSDTNVGFGKANNLGLQYALDNDYDFVYLLNQDAWVMPDTFENLINISRKHPEYGILSPMQMKADLEHMDGNFVTNVICNHQRVEPFFVEDLFFNRKKEVYEVSFVMAAHWLITRKCLEIVGGFNPSFPHYGEDENYTIRTNYWKFKVGIVPCACGIHDRANPVWSKEKWDYIKQYIRPIINASNPKANFNLFKYAFFKGGKALIKGDKINIQYAYRLFKERTQIENNFKRSTLPKAFLI